MNVADVAAVLVKIRLGDNRNVDDLVIREWEDGVGDLNYADCVEAVRMHRRESAAYLQVFHVRDNVRVLLARRARELRVNSPREIESNVITLDRAEFERLTQAAIDAKKAG
jgi:hypothetical protein